MPHTVSLHLCIDMQPQIPAPQLTMLCFSWIVDHSGGELHAIDPQLMACVCHVLCAILIVALVIML